MIINKRSGYKKTSFVMSHNGNDQKDVNPLSSTSKSMLEHFKKIEDASEKRRISMEKRRKSVYI